MNTARTESKAAPLKISHKYEAKEHEEEPVRQLKPAKHEIVLNHLPIWGQFNEPYPNTNLTSIVEEGLGILKSQASSLASEINSPLPEQTFEETSFS
jgi:hypothetical protein